MEPPFALILLKRLVKNNQFFLVNRKSKHAFPVTKKLAKLIVRQLTLNDFVKEDEDKQFPGEYVWIFVTSFGIKYYIKFKFINNLQSVLFISFHEAKY